jgi:hypothetical protein
MPTTGETCPRSGIYAPDCRGPEIALNQGERFPKCVHCNRVVHWTLIRAIA